MLRVTHVLTDGAPAIRLEGKLVGPWVEEFRTFMTAAGEAAGGETAASGHPFVATPSVVRLDLADVTFIDDAGVDLLRQLLRHGATLVAASNFAAELLRTAAATKEGARE